VTSSTIYRATSRPGAWVVLAQQSGIMNTTMRDCPRSAPVNRSTILDALAVPAMDTLRHHAPTRLQSAVDVRRPTRAATPNTGRRTG
jgi:hypothetical protein